ncbi:hypothetical protein TcasGA2_TC033156 [Tribolium castaneum]|uniref:Uncharacterized protein n=1 Tax=Tribolium castaneum TaxID=7070 RepID=A0A139WH54_TRICA|nr:hypothetical protein TcasGA2_TC033156 [Tribolium castaneum]
MLKLKIDTRLVIRSISIAEPRSASTSLATLSASAVASSTNTESLSSSSPLLLFGRIDCTASSVSHSATARRRFRQFPRSFSTLGPLSRSKYVSSDGGRFSLFWFSAHFTQLGCRKSWKSPAASCTSSGRPASSAVSPTSSSAGTGRACTGRGRLVVHHVVGLLHEDVARLLQHCGHQQVLVQADAASVRARLCDFRQGNSD